MYASLHNKIIQLLYKQFITFKHNPYFWPILVFMFRVKEWNLILKIACTPIWNLYFHWILCHHWPSLTTVSVTTEHWPLYQHWHFSSGCQWPGNLITTACLFVATVRQCSGGRWPHGGRVWRTIPLVVLSFTVQMILAHMLI